MVNPQVLEFIDKELKAGKKKETIETALFAKGWTDQDVQIAFQYLVPAGIQTKPVATQPAITPVPIYHSPSQSTPAPNIMNLKSLRWYELVALVPAILLLMGGGALGGLFGGVGWALSLKVIRNDSLSLGLKVLAVIGITVGYGILYLLSAVVLLSFLGPSR